MSKLLINSQNPVMTAKEKYRTMTLMGPIIMKFLMRERAGIDLFDGPFLGPRRDFVAAGLSSAEKREKR
jgi:hypothetical protein